MDINNLKMFITLADKLSFTEAAKVLDISQPTLSRKIRAIETEINAPLFHRMGNTLSLTPRGEVFVEAVKNLINNFEDAVDNLTLPEQKVKGNIKVGCLHPMARHLSNILLPYFHKKYPHIKLHIHIINPQGIEQFQDYDIVISPFYPFNDLIVCKKFSDFKKMPYASPDYLKNTPAITEIGDLSKHECIVQSDAVQNTAIWQLTNEQGIEARVTMNQSISSNSMDIAKEMAINGLGCVLLPENQTRELVKQNKLVKILDGQWFQNGSLYFIYKQSSNIPRRFKIFMNEFRLAHQSYKQANE